MTYLRNTPNTGPTPFSDGKGIGTQAPESGSYIRLAPSADELRDMPLGELKVGDLILSTTTDLDSAAIRSYTESPASHIALYIGDGQVMEAIGSGVTVHPITTALADNFYAAAYRKSDLTDAERDSMVRWLRTQEGRPYDVGSLLSDFTNDADAWFCSELVFAAFAHVGKPLSTTAPHDSEPGQILTMSGVTYLGHLKRPGMAATQGGGDSSRSGNGAFAPTDQDRDAMITPGYAGMTYDIGNLQVGDMVVTSANSAVSQAIREHTGQPASHVALYVGDGMVVEAVSGGVVQNTLSYTVGQTDLAAAYRMPNLTDADRRQIKAFAMDAIARRVQYDYRAIATLQRWQDDDRLFCSELVFEAYASAGKSLGSAQSSTPGQVITLRGIEYLGHLPARRDGHTSVAHSTSATGTNPVIQAAIDAGATEAEARAYFGSAMSKPMSGPSVTLPDVSFLSESDALMAGVRAMARYMFPLGDPLDVLFDFCTRKNLCLAIGVHAGTPIPQLPFINVGGSGGIVVAPNRRAGVYTSGNIGVGWNLEVAGGIEVTLVTGGESSFNGLSFTVGGSIDASEGPGVGFRYILNTRGRMIGMIGELNMSLGVPGASAVELTAALAFTESAMITVPALSLSATDHPELTYAIRIAMKQGATEEEARAFLTASTMSHPMTRRVTIPLSGNEIPPYTPITGWRKFVVTTLLDRAARLFFLSPSAMLATLAREKNISIGIGSGLTAGLGGSAGGGVGAVFLPNGDMAIYGSFSIGGGWNFEISLSYDLTIINGDASAFFGDSMVVGGSVSLDAGVSIGGGVRSVLPPNGGDPIGVIVQGTIGLGLPLISTVEAGLQQVTTRGLSHSQSATQMIGGLPLRAPTRSLSAPNVIPFSQRARAFSAAEDIDVKLRVFIPAPALDAPPTWVVAGDTRYFSGDDRGFQYSGGTSRAEIHAKVRLTPDASGTATVVSASRNWGASHQYDPNDVRHTPGKPAWWHETVGSARPIASATLPTTDSNLAFTARPNAVAGGETGASFGNFRMLVDGGIPLITNLAPNINARLDLELKRGASGTLMAHLYGLHDGFPAYEVYVEGQRIHHYDPVAAGATPTALFGTGQGDRSVNIPWRDIQGAATTQSLSYERNRIWM